MDIHQIEKRSLTPAKWANLFMGSVGITVGILSNASALFLDGLFSGVNFLAAVFAARVAASIQKKPDIMRPFGYEINEPMYVMFRSMALTGVILLAVMGALGKIVQYASGVAIPPIRMGWIMIYVLIMLAICFALAVWHNVNWIKSGRESDLLKTERTAALIDGLLSSVAGLAFFGISLLKGTSLDFIVPVSDSIVVIVLSALMIPAPIRMFFSAAGEVAGKSAEAGTVSRLAGAVRDAIADRPFTFLDIAAVKTGRWFFAAAYIRPDAGNTVQDLDDIRISVQGRCEKVTPSIRTEIIYTAAKPFD